MTVIAVITVLCPCAPLPKGTLCSGSLLGFVFSPIVCPPYCEASAQDPLLYSALLCSALLCVSLLCPADHFGIRSAAAREPSFVFQNERI